MGNVTYTLVYGGTTTTYTSSGELYAVGENAQLIMQVTDYMSGVTVDDSSENAGNFLTTLIEGSQDYVDLSKSSTTHFYLQSGGAIRKETVTLLEGKDLSIDTTIGTTDTVKVDKGDEFVIPALPELSGMPILPTTNWCWISTTSRTAPCPQRTATSSPWPPL